VESAICHDLQRTYQIKTHRTKWNELRLLDLRHVGCNDDDDHDHDHDHGGSNDAINQLI
jgi:hypothetical protein